MLKNRTGKTKFGLVNNGCYFRFEYPDLCRTEKEKSKIFYERGLFCQERKTIIEICWLQY